MASTPGQLATFFAALKTELAHVAPIFRGSDSPSNAQEVPVYEFIRRSSKPTPILQQALTNPPIVAAKRVTFEVRAWGKDDDDLEGMEAALFTALRRIKGSGKFSIDYASDLTDVAALRDGAVEVFLVDVYFVIPQVVYPTTAAAPGDIPGDTVTADVGPTKVVTDFEPDASGETRGDGILAEGET